MLFASVLFLTICRIINLVLAEVMYKKIGATSFRRSYRLNDTKTPLHAALIS